MDVQHRQVPLVAEHSLEQLNANPALLAETFKPMLTANQQASDLRHVFMYNHFTRKLVEPTFERWYQHRGITVEELYEAIKYPVYNAHPTYKMQFSLSNPAKAVQVAITFYRLFQSAKHAGHTNLAIQSAKKLLDYHLFCLLAVSELEHRADVPQQSAWFEECIEFLSPLTEIIASESVSQTSSAAGPPASSGGPASDADRPAISESPPVVQDPNGATSTANSTTNDYLRYNNIIESLICKDLDHVSDWKDITLDPKLKRAMNNQILRPLRLPTASIGMTVGVLMHGVPGCGKTYLCQALAKAARVTFFNVACSAFISKWQGESEKLVQMLFKVAIERQPSIIFVDEVEGLMKQLEGSDTFSVENIKREILVEMSNIKAKKHRVTVIGASNRPNVLDEAFVRRFRLTLHIPPPDTTMKARLLQTVLDDVTHRLSQDEIVRLANSHVLEGATVAHMADVIYTLYLDLADSIEEAEYFLKTTQQDGSIVIVPYKPDPTLRLPKDCVHFSWEDFILEEQRLLRPNNPIVYKDLYDAFEHSPSPIDAATLELHLQWSRKFGSSHTR